MRRYHCMKKRLTAKEAALKWNLTERSVTGLCRSGKIPDVCKENGAWYIPYDAKKPSDGRIHSGKYIVQKSKQQLPLPIGISDFRVASTRYYYVDKTMMIKDFLDEQPMVSLFTRPRRFGKTLNMDMLKVFFEHTDEDTSVYFRDRKSGNRENTTGIIRESIRLYLFHSKMLNAKRGMIRLRNLRKCFLLNIPGMMICLTVPFAKIRTNHISAVLWSGKLLKTN